MDLEFFFQQAFKVVSIETHIVHGLRKDGWRRGIMIETMASLREIFLRYFCRARQLGPSAHRELLGVSELRVLVALSTPFLGMERFIGQRLAVVSNVWQDIRMHYGTRQESYFMGKNPCRCSSILPPAPPPARRRDHTLHRAACPRLKGLNPVATAISYEAYQCVLASGFKPGALRSKLIQRC